MTCTAETWLMFRNQALFFWGVNVSKIIPQPIFQSPKWLLFKIAKINEDSALGNHCFFYIVNFGNYR
eukprot:m.88337 g.88337  ORF g.88337 m.88337 type:complete len:67 (-) comp13159_c0_seq4:34-234(-)